MRHVCYIYLHDWVFVGATVGIHIPAPWFASGTVELSNRNLCEDCQIAYTVGPKDPTDPTDSLRAGEKTRSACSNTCGAGTAERQATRWRMRGGMGVPGMESWTRWRSRPFLGCSRCRAQKDVSVFWFGKSWEQYGKVEFCQMLLIFDEVCSRRQFWNLFYNMTYCSPWQFLDERDTSCDSLDKQSCLHVHDVHRRCVYLYLKKWEICITMYNL